jgi:hypothetical protein
MEVGDEKSRKFKRLVGFDDLPGSDEPGGVLVDWHKLPTVLSDDVKGLRLDWESMSPFKSGIGTAQWTWERRDRQLHVEVFVSGTGATAARQRLLEIATDTTTVESHMVLAVEPLGDLAIEYCGRTGNDMVWVFRNVCVVVENDGNGPDVLSVSRRIQTFMEAHVVADVARYVPAVTRIDLSPSPIRVGDTFRVTVHLGGHVSVPDVMIEFRPADASDVLDWEENRGLERTFLAREAGRTGLEIHVVDRKSLLSRKAGIVIDVLPTP